LLFHDIDYLRQGLTEQFELMEQERGQLKVREAELGQREEGATSQLQYFKAELEKRDLQLARALDDLQAARAELARPAEQETAATRQATELSAQLQSLRAALEDMQRESRALQRERDALQESARQSELRQSRIDDLEQELQAVRRQLDEAQMRISSPNTNARASQPHEVNALALTALEQEREALESELELVRTHAAELNETVAQQQREIAAQKTEMSTELQQLRKLVEKQADLIADRVVTTRDNTPAAGASPPVPTPPSDPVVNSVMAQFAKLQKDVAQRRKRKT